MARTVTVLPPTINRQTAAPIGSMAKRKVAAYARVSTDHEEQQSSYEAQCDYYTNFIKARDDWEFVGIYSDEGISATSTKHREGFQQMVADALAGKIDVNRPDLIQPYESETGLKVPEIRVSVSGGSFFMA